MFRLWFESQAKGFLAANPLLKKKLYTAVVEHLASGGEEQIPDTTAGKIPADSPALFVASEQENSETSAAGSASAEGRTPGDQSSAFPPSSHVDATRSPQEGRRAGADDPLATLAMGMKDGMDRYNMHGGVLLEPGVASESELMTSFVSDSAAKSVEDTKVEKGVP